MTKKNLPYEGLITSAWEHLENRLEERVYFACTQSDFCFPLKKAALYAISSKGKRVRPLFLLHFAKLFGADMKAAVDPAVAIECVHIYSCIHDDLPCMDDDDYRRGKKTLHKAFDEETAVLIGDFFLTLAFETLATSSVSEEKKVDLIRILAEKSGGRGMIAGQFMDIYSEQNTLKKWQENDLLLLQEKKTASLLEAAALFGAVLGNPTEEEKNITTSIAKAFGIAYQITDDILDESSDQLSSGKDLGSDKKQEKITSVQLYGPEKAKQKAFFWYSTCLQELEKLGKEVAPIKSFIESLMSRQY